MLLRDLALPHAPARAVTTIDVWKLAGVISFLVDHYGLFFDPDDNWWRLFGRIAAPIFFFLIGFARSHSVPLSWLVLGAVLTAADYVTSEGLRDTTINILINFALLRLVLPTIETHVMPNPMRLAFLVLASAALIPRLDPILEYGGEGWLWALFGLSHRLLLERGGPHEFWRQYALALAAAGAYVVREISDYEFSLFQGLLLAVVIGRLVSLLIEFRRTDLEWQPPRPVSDVLIFAGRRSLEIYAGSLLIMQILAYAGDA
jgi:TraX protein